MLLLTLTQPWATLVALGEKRWETRDWPPPETARGDLVAIHAAKTFGGLRGIRLPGSVRDLPLTPDGLASLCNEWPFADVLYGDHGDRLGVELPPARQPGDRSIGKAIARALPLGAVVAVAIIERWHPADEIAGQLAASPDRGIVRAGGDYGVGAHELHFGNYAPGRWAWRLEGVRPLSRPYELRGQRRLMPVAEPDRDAIMTLVDLDPPQPQEAA